MFAEFEFCFLAFFAGLGESDFGVGVLDFSRSHALVLFCAKGLHNDTGSGKHCIAVNRPEDTDGNAVVDTGGVILDGLNGVEVGKGGEIVLGGDVSGLPVGEVEAFAVGEGAIACLAAAVKGGVAGFLVNAWTCVTHDDSPWKVCG